MTPHGTFDSFPNNSAFMKFATRPKNKPIGIPTDKKSTKFKKFISCFLQNKYVAETTPMNPP
jgi:hypothetical protein